MAATESSSYENVTAMTRVSACSSADSRLARGSLSSGIEFACPDFKVNIVRSSTPRELLQALVVQARA